MLSVLPVLRDWLKTQRMGVVLPTLAALAACNSPQDVLDVKAHGPSPPAAVGASANPLVVQPPAAAATTGSTGSLPQQTASAAASSHGVQAARVQFAPIVGTSVEAAKSLSQGLNTRAKQRGLTLVGTGDASRTHMLKGYFTPLKEGAETTVIYVWDVYDPGGSRVHRISGQKKAPAATGDGWASVSPATMQAIADATVDDLAAWLATQPG